MSEEQDRTEPTVCIKPFGEDIAGLVDAVGRLLHRVQDACASYVNSTRLVSMTELRTGENDALFERTFGLDLKDLLVLAAVTQAPLCYRGRTDCGKTALAELGLNALFGLHGENWWRIEVSRGMSEQDMLDVDVKKLTEGKLSEAMSALPWLRNPGKLLDEINRAPAKLNNILLHLVDGSGLHLRGNLYLPVGTPYTVNGTAKRYSFAVATANEQGADYDGTFAEDAALLRRMVLAVNMDNFMPSVHDVAILLETRRPKNDLPPCDAMVETLVRVYESLRDTLRLSPLAHLFILYLTGLSNCVRTRSGRVRVDLGDSICKGCRVSKAHRFCGRVLGLSSGLMLWCNELARGIAAIRAAKVLRSVREDCLAGRPAAIQEFLGSEAYGEDLYAVFRERYLADFAVQGEDVVCAYQLLAPHHVFIDKGWLAKQPQYENCEQYAFADVANASWEAMTKALREHEDLFAGLARNEELSPAEQAEVEAVLMNEDPALLSVISALREKRVVLKSREAMFKAHAA